MKRFFYLLIMDNRVAQILGLIYVAELCPTYKNTGVTLT